MRRLGFVNRLPLSSFLSPPISFISVPDQERLDRNSRVLWVVVGTMGVATIAGYWIADLSFAWSTIVTIGLCGLPFIAISAFYRRFRPDPLISFVTEAFAQLLLAMTLGAALSYPLAVTGFPYSDDLLNSADTWMGLDWRAYLKLINDHPLLARITDLAYDSMLAQLLILMLALVSAGRLVRFQRFVLANALGLCIAVVVFAFVPAGGIYGFLQIEHSEYANISPVMTVDQKIYLDALRSGKHALIDDMEGLITFPSFHSAWAIFYMWAFYPLRWLRIGAILLNLAVLAATPVQGAHYFVDLIGGSFVAGISIWIAVRLTRSTSPLLR